MSLADKLNFVPNQLDKVTVGPAVDVGRAILPPIVKRGLRRFPGNRVIDGLKTAGSKTRRTLDYAVSTASAVAILYGIEKIPGVHMQKSLFDFYQNNTDWAVGLTVAGIAAVSLSSSKVRDVARTALAYSVAYGMNHRKITVGIFGGVSLGAAVALYMGLSGPSKEDVEKVEGQAATIEQPLEAAPTTPEISALVSAATPAPTTDLSDYAKKSEVPTPAPTTDLSDYAKKSEVPTPGPTPDLSGYVTKDDLTAALAGAEVDSSQKEETQTGEVTIESELTGKEGYVDAYFSYVVDMISEGHKAAFASYNDQDNGIFKTVGFVETGVGTDQFRRQTLVHEDLDELEVMARLLGNTTENLPGVSPLPNKDPLNPDGYNKSSYSIGGQDLVDIITTNKAALSAAGVNAKFLSGPFTGQ